jgi:hypothetical protein
MDSPDTPDNSCQARVVAASGGINIGGKQYLDSWLHSCYSAGLLACAPGSEPAGSMHFYMIESRLCT